MNKRALTFAAAFSVVALIGFLLWQVNEVVIYFIMSLILGAMIRPLADLLKDRPKWQAILITIGILLLLAGFGYLLYLAFMRISRETNLLVNTVSNLKQWYLPVWLERLNFTRSLLNLLPPPGEIFDIVTTDGGKVLMPAIQTVSRNLVTIISGLVIIIFLSLYWTGSQDRFERLWLSLLSVEKRQKARMIWRDIDTTLGDYGRYLLVRFFLTWVVVSIGAFYLRSPYPVMLGMIVALANLLPVVGGILALLLTLAIGLLSSILFYPWVLVYVFVVLVLLGIFVWPKLYKERWDAPILRLLFFLIIGETMGLRWLILAPPLAIVVQTVWNGVSNALRTSKPLEGLDSLQAHQDLLEHAVSELDETPPALTNNLNRLDDLLEKAEEYLKV